MRWPSLFVAVAGCWLVAGMLPLQASEQPKKRFRTPQEAQPGYWGDQRGCYWHRGRRFCSRYCYWDVDGQRYCQERERQAHPQGDPWFIPYPPEPPIYLAPPHVRPR